MQTRYKVTTEGKLRDGTDPDQFVKSFAQAFKISEDQARKLLTAGRTVTLKEDVDRDTAEKFHHVLTEQMGLEVSIEAKQPPADPFSGGLSLEEADEPPASTATGGGLSLEADSGSTAAPASAGGLSLEGGSGSTAAPTSGGGLSLEENSSSSAAPASADGVSMQGENATSATSETAASTSAIDSGGRCPKCGSDRISGDDCLACGIIISRYRARQAEMGEQAPSIYAAPSANVEPEQDDDREESFGIRSVDAGAGWQWILGGWKLFMQSPGIWILNFIIWFVILIIASMIPILGPLATNLFSPVFTAGFMLGADEQRRGGDLTVGHLFAGFSTEFSNLVVLGLLTIGASIVTAVIMFIFGFGALITHANDSGFSAGSVIFLIIIILVLAAVMGMAFLFAPQLVIFERLSPIDAIKMSFTACWKNIIPFLVYGVIVVGLALIASIPLFLGFIVLAPVLFASMFAAYRSIFYDEHS